MSLFISSFKKLFTERIIVGLLFFLCFTVFFYHNAPKSDEKRVIENNSFWKRKTFDKKKYSIVAAGDSRVYRGVSPEVMNEVLSGYRIINFGYGSAGFSKLMLQEIDKRIDYSADNKVVVLGITPLSLTNEGFKNWHLTFELKTKKEELMELIYFKHVLQFFIPFTFKKFEDKIKGKEFVTSLTQEYMPSGWVASSESRPWPSAAIQSYKTRFIRNQVTEDNINTLMEQVEIWVDKGVKVLGMRPPTTHEMVALEDSVSGYNEAQIRAIFSQKGGVWLDFSSDDYYSYDGSHLQKESAINFSRDIACSIKYLLNSDSVTKPKFLK